MGGRRTAARQRSAALSCARSVSMAQSRTLSASLSDGPSQAASRTSATAPCTSFTAARLRSISAALRAFLPSFPSLAAGSASSAPASRCTVSTFAGSTLRKPRSKSTAELG